MKEYTNKQGTPHIWMNGPDGQNYHCPVCGIDKCDDHASYDTCESHILRTSARIISSGRIHSLSSLENNRQQWREYLVKQLGA